MTEYDKFLKRSTHNNNIIDREKYMGLSYIAQDGCIGIISRTNGRFYAEADRFPGIIEELQEIYDMYYK
jgi:hypothetical protein